jgi:hypothetical protein
MIYIYASSEHSAIWRPVADLIPRENEISRDFISVRNDIVIEVEIKVKWDELSWEC